MDTVSGKCKVYNCYSNASKFKRIFIKIELQNTTKKNEMNEKYKIKNVPRQKLKTEKMVNHT